MCELKFKSGIYKITINDYYVYIGQSMDIKLRWKQHLNQLKQNKHCNKKLQNVFNKYPNLIKFEIIEKCDESELDSKEMFYIERFNTFNSDHGLNLSIGGDCGSRKYKTEEDAKVNALKKHKEYYQDNKDCFKQWAKQYYTNNKEQLKVKFKQYYQDNKDYFKQYRQNNKDGNKVYAKQYYQDNKDRCKERDRQYYNLHIEERKQYSERYRQENKDKIKERRKQKGILSWKEKFEKHYNLSRPLTNEEWDIWRNTKNHQKPYAIKFLKSLPNL